MLFTKAFVALAAASAAAASPYAAKRQSDAATCDFVLLPDATIPPGTNLVAEFNFVIGRALSIATGGTIDQFGSSFTANTNGTYSVVDTISAAGETAAETAAIITGWVGLTEPGIAANWLVEYVDCD